MNKNFIILLLGISGVGKTSVAFLMKKKLKEKKIDCILIEPFILKEYLLLILKKKKLYKKEYENKNIIDLHNLFGKSYVKYHRLAWKSLIREINIWEKDTVIIITSHCLVKRDNNFREICNKEIIKIINPDFCVLLTESSEEIKKRRIKTKNKKIIEKGFFSLKGIGEENLREKECSLNILNGKLEIYTNRRLKDTVNFLLDKLP